MTEQAPVLFDIVVPVGPNDIKHVSRQLACLHYAVGRRNIYVVTVAIDGVLPQFADCYTIDEATFPFTLNDVALRHGKRSRNGWYLQQMLKLYAGFVIDGILDTYLVVDADTYLQRPVEFIADGKPMYTVGHEYNYPYFTHMVKLHPSLRRMNQEWSGISHHMVFTKKHLTHLFQLVEGVHGKKFWEVFFEQVVDYDMSGASEYEIYFNFLLAYYPDEIAVRRLAWDNRPVAFLDDADTCSRYDYISCHHYLG
jgi:hypothetical protein